MGKTTNKIRQIFNLFLLLALISVAVGIAVWFMTKPESRTTPFWISMAAIFLSVLITTLFASRIAWRGDGGRQTPHAFAQFFLVGLYIAFTIAMAFVNANKDFSVVTLFLIHVAGVVVLLVPLILINMAALKVSGSDRKLAQEGRENLATNARRLSNLAEDLERALPGEKERMRALRELADNLNYADPNPAPRNLEQGLKEAVKGLQEEGDFLLAASEAERPNRLENVLRACVKAKRALEERNDAVLRSRGK